MKKLLLLLLLLIPLVNAEVEQYPVNMPIDLQFVCTLDDAIPSSNTAFNISIYNPGGAIVVNNKQATAQGLGSFNYTYTFTTTGIYQVKMFCYNGTVSFADNSYYNIIGVGNTEDKGLTETTVILILAMIISLFIYQRLSKFFGSMLVFILGFGTLFMIRASGWIAWTIIGSGFLMLIYALVEPKRAR